MKSISEHLRNLSKTHRERVRGARQVAENMKKVADEAAKAAKGE